MPMLNQRSDQQIWRPELSRQRGPRGCTIAGALIVHIFAAGGLFLILQGHEEARLHQVALQPEENAAAIAGNRDLRLPLDDTAVLRAELLTSAGPVPRAELMPELGADTDAEASDRATALPSTFESPHAAASAQEPEQGTAVRRSPPRRPNPTVGFAAPPAVALPKPTQDSPRYQIELVPPIEPPPAPLPGEPWQFVH
jgi:hypothetical protein